MNVWNTGIKSIFLDWLCNFFLFSKFCITTFNNTQNHRYLNFSTFACTVLFSEHKRSVVPVTACPFLIPYVIYVFYMITSMQGQIPVHAITTCLLLRSLLTNNLNYKTLFIYNNLARDFLRLYHFLNTLCYS